MKNIILSSLVGILLAITFVPNSVLFAAMLDSSMPRSDYFNPAENAHYFSNGLYDYILTVKGSPNYTIGNNSKYQGAKAKSESAFWDQNGKLHNNIVTSSSSAYAYSHVFYRDYTVTGSYQKSTSV